MDTGLNPDCSKIEELKQLFAVILLRFGESTQLADDKSTALIQAMRRKYPGGAVYLSQATKTELDDKKTKFRAEFNGKNLPALCKKYQISPRQGYRWLG